MADGVARNNISEAATMADVQNMASDTISAAWSLADSGHTDLRITMNITAYVKDAPESDPQQVPFKFTVKEKVLATAQTNVDNLLTAIGTYIAASAYATIDYIRATAVVTLTYTE